MKISKRKATGALAQMIANIDDESLRRTKEKMAVASRIADAVKAKGWSQKDFAKQMNKSEAEISDWLSGERNFTIETLFDIESVLNISLIVKTAPIYAQVPNVQSVLIKRKSVSRFSVKPTMESWFELGEKLITFQPQLING